MQRTDILSSLPTAMYMLLIQPHEALCDTIQDLRVQLHTTYHTETLMKTKPGILLAKFTAYSANEQYICQLMQQAYNYTAPLCIELDGVGSYPMHTIYLKVKNTNDVKGLQKKLKAKSRYLKAGDEDPYFPDVAVITIANKISKDIYQKAIIEYEQKNFNARFMANEIILLRKNNDADFYREFKRFQTKGRSAHVELPTIF